MKNAIFIIIFLLIAGKAHAVGNGSGTATTTPSIVENVSPDAIFDKVRGFLTVPVPNLNIPANAPEMLNFNASGVQDLNDQIRDITGVNIFQFLRFLWDVFLALVRYVLELIPKTIG